MLTSAWSSTGLIKMLLTLSCRNSRLLCHYFAQQPKPCLRNIKLLASISKPALVNKSEHRIIYDFPAIKFLVVITRTKNWVPAVGVAISPLLYFLDESHVSPFITVASAGIFFTLGYYFSKVIKNTVGKMYVNKEGAITDVIISSVDVAGRRIDRIHAVNDIINTDFSSSFARQLGFTHLAVENSDIYYNLNIRSCKFIDEQACDYILGADYGIINSKRDEDKDNKKHLQE